MNASSSVAVALVVRANRHRPGKPWVRLPIRQVSPSRQPRRRSSRQEAMNRKTKAAKVPSHQTSRKVFSPRPKMKASAPPISQTAEAMVDW